MATEAAAPSPAPSAQLVGNAFVEQYYLILHTQPELVHRFYQDSSVLSRPGPNGDMSAVSTQTAINEKIMSLNYNNHKTEIKTVDAQESHQEGVVVLVTGCLIAKDDVKPKKFTQTFFLAPQDKGYFVLNDVFRYIDENDHIESNSVSVNGAPEIIQSTPVTPDPVLFAEPAHVPDLHVVEQTSPAAEVVLSNGDAVQEPSDTDESVVEDAVGAPVYSNEVQVHTVSEPTSTVQEDAPKKSYASIVKVMKGNKTPASFYVPINGGKVAPANAAKVAAAVTEQKPVGPATTPAPEAPAPSNNNASESSHPEEAEGHSIYIRSLPLTVTVAQVEEEFKKFGDIKPNGVQVRSNKGFCFGFVEFESISSMEKALSASPVTIGGRQAHVEEKRTTTRVTGGRPSRFPQGRGGGFRNENFRGRGNFGGGRGYSRNEFGNRGDFSGRRGSGGRSGDGYQRVDNGNGRVGRQGAMNQATVAV